MDALEIMQSAQIRDEPAKPSVDTRLALASALTALRRAKPTNGTDAAAIHAARRNIVQALKAA